MYAKEEGSAWSKKGATLSDKSVRKEYELTQEEIIKAIREEKLQYRINYVYENPYFKLIRSEVETLVNEKYGSNYLKKKKIEKELAQVKKELRMLKSKAVSLGKRKAELLASLDK